MTPNPRELVSSPRMERIVGIGAGGHCRVLVDIIHRSGAFAIVGLVDRDLALVGRLVEGVRVLGGDSLLPELFAAGVSAAFIGVGSVADNGPRAAIFERARSLGFRVPSLVHSTAALAGSSSIEDGAVVAAQAVLGPGTRCGVNTIVNTGARVDHDCALGDHVHISPGAVLAGGVTVESYAHVGLGALVRQGVRVGAAAVVGMGAVVLRDVPAGRVVFGNPAREERPPGRGGAPA